MRLGLSARIGPEISVDASVFWVVWVYYRGVLKGKGGFE